MATDLTASLMNVAEDISERWSIFKHAQEIVDEKFEDGRDYAKDALNTAKDTIQSLMNLALELEAVDINIPFEDLTTIDIADFEATKPTPPDPDSLVLNLPTKLDDAEDLNEAIRQKLLNDITNASAAIPDSVRDAIFNKDVERSLLVHHDNLDTISEEWSKRRFILPDSVLMTLISQAEIEYSNKRLDVSRDLTIKDFELTDTNIKFAVERGIAWYGMRVETYKALVQAEISRVEAIVRTFVAEVEAYRGEAAVYTALVDTKIKKFDAEVKQVMVRADLLMKKAELDIKNHDMLNQIKLEGFKAIGAIASQVAAGALSSVSASAHISASNSASYNYTPPSEE
jgi:hypothetical protein